MAPEPMHAAEERIQWAAKLERWQKIGAIFFLIAGCQQHRQAFWHNEEPGERRVNFFPTLKTAVIAAISVKSAGLFPGGRTVRLRENHIR